MVNIVCPECGSKLEKEHETGDFYCPECFYVKTKPEFEVTGYGILPKDKNVSLVIEGELRTSYKSLSKAIKEAKEMLIEDRYDRSFRMLDSSSALIVVEPIDVEEPDIIRTVRRIK